MKKVFILLMLLLAISSIAVSAESMEKNKFIIDENFDFNNHFEDFILLKKFGNEKIKEILTEPQSINITLTGDMGFGSNYGKKKVFHETFLNQPTTYYFENLKEEFDSSDLIITNLENVFTDSQDYLKGKIFTYKAYSKEYINILKDNNITYVNVVNNHMQDYKQKGLDDTLLLLEEKGINYFGTNKVKSTSVEIGDVLVDNYETFEKNGIKIGLLGYYGFYSSKISDKDLKEDIDYLRNVEKVDYIIVSMHWGGQNTQKVSPLQRELGKKIIDAGADLVWGNHPHVLQEIEDYKGKKIYYSLGNFLFIDYGTVKDTDTILLNLTLEKDYNGNITETFKNIPVNWNGHSWKNIFKPYIITDKDIIKRIEDKIKAPCN